MEPWLLLVFFIIGFSLFLAACLAVWLVVRAVRSAGRIEELLRRLGELELEVFRLKQARDSAREPRTAPAPTPILQAPPIPTAAKAPVPPVTPKKEIEAALQPQPQPVSVAPVSPALSPPRIPTTVRPAATPGPTIPSVNWEQFMGVKLFAWVGGLALFLGVAFFVKYSFDNDLVPPQLRVAIGFVSGLGLMVGGVVMSRKDYAVLSQTLCATGVVILYAVTFACRSIYHFAFFGPIPTFLLMALITTTAFFLAVRLNALVVAILGMLGGFLTPILLSTGQDNPLGLFGYIAILDAGLILVAINRRWFFLTALAAIGTALMQVGWADKFFSAEKYYEGNKVLVALGVLLGFTALYALAAGWAKRRAQANWWLAGSTFGLAAVALAFTGWFLTFPPLAARPWLMFSFMFLIDLVVAALALLDDKSAVTQPLAGLAVFGLLALWTSRSLTGDLLNPALAFYFIFAVMHAVFPIVQRRRGVTTPLWGSQLFPPLALLLVLIPIFKLTELSFVVWPFVLLVDLLAIGLAVLTVSLLPVLAVLLLTLAATGALIFKIPANLTGLPTSLFLLGAFAVFFVVASLWLVRKLKPATLATGIKFSGDFAQVEILAALLPMFSGALPFLLLIMATLRLPLANPTPVFGVALLLVVLLLGMAKMFSFDWIPAVALVGVTALECAWHFHRFDIANPSVRPTVTMAWYVLFLAVFTLFPFLFLKQFANKLIPWATAALAGLPQFFLMHRLVAAAWPNQVMGLLPMVFAVPSLLGLVIVLKKIPAPNTARVSQLAWFAGVALFFITLIFPIQFERQWITIGWALEGVALLWLFHRIPHRGLQLTGVGLLLAAFVRLAFNPAVFEYHPRAEAPILNWYLYAYGVVTLCLFVGAWLLAPPRHQLMQINVPPILGGLGTVLAFLLLNIEIADYFSAPGSTLTFQFSGNFARDMTYSIAWALFALILLVIGILKRIPAARYGAMGLLCVTMLKLFVHDLARLGQLYRIGAFIGVAIIAMLASFAYQRFYTASNPPKDTKDETAH